MKSARILRKFRSALIPGMLVGAASGAWVLAETEKSLTPAERGQSVLAQRAEPWPVWRGDPAMTGIAKEALVPPLALQWKFPAASPIKATAVSDGTRFFIGDGKGKFFALEAATGKPAWEFTAKDAIEGSAVLVNGLVVFGGVDGTVYALDAASGAERWKFATEAEIRSGANVFERKGKPPLVLVGSYDNRLYALDSATGNKVWSAETGNYVNGSASVVDGNTTAFGGCDGFLYVVNLEDGTEVGKIDVQNPIASTVASRAGVAVVGHYGNEIVAVESAGLKPKWTYKDREFPFFSSPAITDGGLVLAGDRGKRLHCLKLDDGNEEWSFRTKGRVDSSPVVSGASVFVGSDDGSLYAVALKDGSEQWSYAIGQPIASSPCLSGGRLVIGADDGVVYCFGAAGK